MPFIQEIAARAAAASPTPSIIPALPPPPGEVSNFVNPLDISGIVYRSGYAFTICAFIIVLLRIYTRLSIVKAGLGADDCKYILLRHMKEMLTSIFRHYHIDNDMLLRFRRRKTSNIRRLSQFYLRQLHSKVRFKSCSNIVLLLTCRRWRVRNWKAYVERAIRCFLPQFPNRKHRLV